MHRYLIYLATADDWCTIYTSDSLPDCATLMTAVPQILIWDVLEVRYG